MKHLFLACLVASVSTVAHAQVPVRLNLDKAATVTLVIENAAGGRVRNLVSAQKMAAGGQSIEWDGRDEDGRLVAPGAYHVRGLTRDGLELRYELAVQSPGNPPWHTLDRTGAWMADHSPPQATLFLPRGVSPYGGGAAQVLVASQVSEVGQPLVWLDLNGKKLYGGDKIEGWNGGVSLARDIAPRAAESLAADPLVADPFAFTLVVGGSTARVYALKRDGSTPQIGAEISLAPLKLSGEQERESGFALAVYNGMIVVCDPILKRLIFMDLKGQVLGAPHIFDPSGVAFDASGRLLVASGRTIRRFEAFDDLGALKNDDNWWRTTGEVLVGLGGPLEAPRSISVALGGELFVSDHGRSHQVRVFASDGRFLRSIGRAGGPQLGRYDERRMQLPSQVAFDDRGQMWVGEADYLPKRLSLWKPDGTFVRAFYGPPRYGGGGTLDPTDKTRFYYSNYQSGTVEFALDWKSGTSKPSAILWRPALQDADSMTQAAAPDWPITLNGERYLTNALTPGLRYNEDARWGIWKIGPDEIARPVMMWNNGDWISHGVHGYTLRFRQEIMDKWKGRDRNRVQWLWSDLNGDAFVQPNEVQWREMSSVAYGAYLHPDFSISTGQGTLIPAPRFDSRGTPIYDLNKMVPLPGATPGSPALRVGRQMLAMSESEENRRIYGSEIGGARPWFLRTYQDPIENQLVQTTRLLGFPVTPKAGDAGPLVAINGEKGAMFLVTLDGLFVGTLGADERTHPILRAPEAVRGMSIDGVSFAGEHFAPTITQTRAGDIYLTAGHEFSAVFRLDGLDSVRRRDFGTVQVTAAQLVQAPAPALPQGEMKRAVIASNRAGAQPIFISPGVSALMWIEGERLQVLWRTDDADLLRNIGTDARYAFKTGGALDLMFGPAIPARSEPVAGDLRLLVTQLRGQKTAVLYRAIVAADEAPGARPDASNVVRPDENNVAFVSPVGRAEFARVLEVSDQVQLGSKGGEFQVSAPLSLLGITRGQTMRGDVGILRGNGSQTTRRLYWSNRATDIVSDIPSEARLQPEHWGQFQVAP